jgi:ABC-type polysaccharide/polyol phosphate export permease
MKLLSIATAFNDLRMTLRQYALFCHLGYVEVKQRYRRSVLGPWWVSISLAIFIAMMGVVFSRLFKQSMEEYLPFFTAGFIAWTFLCNSILEAMEIFKSNVGFIKQINLPYNIYIFKHLVKQCIYLLHNCVVYLIVALFFRVSWNANTLLVFPGLLLFIVNLYWMSLLVALICARFRDMISIVSSCMQVAFFVTPVSWMPRLLDSQSKILQYNPFVYFLDIIRSPLLGGAPAFQSWVFCTVFALVGCLLSFICFSSVRTRIAFWVD